MSFEVIFAKQVKKDLKHLKSSHSDTKFFELIEVINQNPFQNPPPYKKLRGNMEGLYSRRLNTQHRLVYSVEIKEKVITVYSAWSHYEQ